MDKTKICDLCGEEYEGLGHNPAPLMIKGRVCDSCMYSYVLPARLDVLDLKEIAKASDAEPRKNASKFKINDRVKVKFNGTTFENPAIILDYDHEGTYVILWLDSGNITPGVEDHNLIRINEVEPNLSPEEFKKVIAKVNVKFIK